MFYILGVAGTLSACATAPSIPPRALALSDSANAVASSVELAREESNAVDPIDVMARFNPARCDCPEFEIKIWGAWTRAYLQGSASFLTRLRTFSENEGKRDGFEFITIKGKVTDARKLSTRNVPYLVFEAEEP